jgi:hypothetical protein
LLNQDVYTVLIFTTTCHLMLLMLQL